MSSIQIIARLFLNPHLSCFVFQVIEKNNSSASILNSYNFTILRGVFYSRNVCLKAKYIHFVLSFVAYVSFSSCLRREDQFVVFFPLFPSSRGPRGHTVVMINDPFSDLPFYGSEESV